MTEQEYIDVGNLKSLRAIIEIMSGICPDTQPVIDNREFARIAHIIYDWTLKLSDNITISEEVVND